MLSELLKNILNEHKHYISLSELESVLYNKKMKVKISNYLSHSSLYTVSEGFVFMKKALIDMKTSFLKDFEEHIASKSIDREAVENLKSFYSQLVPDSFYPEWFNTNLENKLIIFDLLLSLIVRNKNSNDPLKKYFSELLDVYSLLTVYSIILVKSNDDNYEKLTGYLQSIDPEEELLKDMVYELLINPLEILDKLHDKQISLSEISDYVDKTVDASFRVSINYSQHLFKKVITNELSKFEPVHILSRYSFESLYEWVLALIDGQGLEITDRLIEDLDL